MRGATLRSSPSFSFLLSTRETFGSEEPNIISFWVSTLTAIQKSRLRECKGTKKCDYNRDFLQKTEFRAYLSNISYGLLLTLLSVLTTIQSAVTTFPVALLMCSIQYSRSIILNNTIFLNKNICAFRDCSLNLRCSIKLNTL